MCESAGSEYRDVAGWELSDSFWDRIMPLLPKPKSRYRGRGKKRKNIGGRPGADRRRVMAGILYVLRTGCQWNALPKEIGSGKTVHRHFQNWERAKVFTRMWQAGLAEYDETVGIAWKWQAMDGTMTKAPLGGQKTGPNPTDRAKKGTKRSILVDEHGIPLGLAVSGANTPDSRLMESTLEAKQIHAAEDLPQNLCLDKGYAGERCNQIACDHGYEPHAPDKANAKKTEAQAWTAKSTKMDC